MADQTLAQIVRAKYPGAYDQLSDAQLEAAVVAKYPGAYDHVRKTTPQPTPAADVKPFVNVGGRGTGLDVRKSDAAAAAWSAAGPERVAQGARNIGNGNVARGTRDLLSGSAVTAAPFAVAPAIAAFTAAPLAYTAATIGGGVAGSLGGQTAERGATALGATPDQAGLIGDVASIGTGAGGAKLATGLTQKAATFLTDYLPEKLYAQIFKYSEQDLRRSYEAISRGQQPNPSLARQMLEQGVVGSDQTMAVYSFQRLGTVEQQLQQRAGRLIMPMPKKQDYVGLLNGIAEQYNTGFFTDRADQARQLSAALQQFPGPSARATDMLAVKRFLDNLRQRSAFQAEHVLAPKQEALKEGADLIRATLHQRPDLSPLITEEQTFIQAADAIIEHAKRSQNRSLFTLLDGLLATSGMPGAAAAASVRGAQTPNVMTGLAQLLFKGGRAVNATGVPSAARTLGTGAVAGGATR